MMRIINVCALMLTVLAATPVQAQQYMMLGAGSSSCGLFVQTKQDRAYRMSWVAGFFTGYNAVNSALFSRDSDVTVGTDIAGLEQWLVNYCTVNPLSTLANATFDLLLELQKNKPVKK